MDYKLFHSKPLQLFNMGMEALKPPPGNLCPCKNVEVNKSQAFSANSFATNTSRVATLEIKSQLKKVKKTELLKAFQSVACHFSHKTIETFLQISKFFFPDSSIPGKLQLRRIKIWLAHAVWRNTFLQREDICFVNP